MFFKGKVKDLLVSLKMIYRKFNIKKKGNSECNKNSVTSLKIPSSVLSQNGRLPQSNMYVITPILHTSDSGPDFRFNTSGAT